MDKSRAVREMEFTVLIVELSSQNYWLGFQLLTPSTLLSSTPRMKILPPDALGTVLNPNYKINMDKSRAVREMEFTALTVELSSHDYWLGFNI